MSDYVYKRPEYKISTWWTCDCGKGRMCDEFEIVSLDKDGTVHILCHQCMTVYRLKVSKAGGPANFNYRLW